jgi:hypothetical protein
MNVLKKFPTLLLAFSIACTGALAQDVLRISAIAAPPKLPVLTCSWPRELALSPAPRGSTERDSYECYWMM